ncbi:MAG: MoaD/ThiS family protein [Actinomycetaceae bacterium]|nr:MoaD/ThiS family protein [Actinomycetaceae bacterium]
MTTIRFFAGAAEAAGASSIEVEAGEGSVGDLLDEASRGNDLLEKVIRRSIFLANGRAVGVDAPAKDITELEVLPPFAGG